IGGAFGKIIDSVVNDLIMPVAGLFTGGLDFSNLFLPLRDAPEGTPHTLAAMKAAGVPVFAWGNFITIVIQFAILAFVVFQLVKFMNRLRREEPVPAPAAAPPEDVILLREIRDALRAR
ncbi:MAG TPA: large conductance mechanosensitive channel protein MscL, partial [Gemmatimonadales bacterium]|nr:large conductance mechanosensitive channel protein MscL [Gemmatimonadales bacterium]